MQKIKNYRSADCVVGGFRYNEGKRVVGSLLLGLYDEAAFCITSGLPQVSHARTSRRSPRNLRNIPGRPGSPVMPQADPAAGRPIARQRGALLSRNS